MTFLSVYSNFPNYKILTNDLCDLDPLTCPELNLPTTTWLCADKGSPPRTPPSLPAPSPLGYAPEKVLFYYIRIQGETDI